MKIIQENNKKVKKILFAVMAIVAAVGLMGGAFAYFSDTEESTGNNFTAGYLDMEMSKGAGWQNPYSGALATAADLAPGEEIGPFGMYLRNIGNISGKVRVQFSYTDYDVPLADRNGEFANYVNVTGEDFAKAMIVKTAKLDSDPDNKSPYWVSTIMGTGLYANFAAADVAGAIYYDGSQYLPTIYGLSLNNVELYFTPAYPTEEEWVQNEQHYEEWTFMLDPGATNDYMFDGINITLLAEMIQYDAPWSGMP